MQVTVKGKQLDVGDALRDHARQRLEDAVAKYFDQAIEASVVLSRDARRLRTDISVHVGRGILVEAHGVGDKAYTAFDSATDRIAKQLRRYKRRLRDHHRKSKSAEDAERLVAQQYILAAPEEDTDEHAEEPGSDRPVVIAEMTTEIENMTVSEAVMRMDLADQPTLVFRNFAHGEINVVYRRADGNFGWVDPAGNSAKRK